MPNNVRVAHFIDEIFASQEPKVDISHVIERVLRENLGYSALQASESAESWEGRVRRQIDKKNQDLRRRGVTPRYEWIDDSKNALFNQEIDTSESHPEIGYRAQIQASLGRISGRQFEHACAELLRIYGCRNEHIEVTVAARDHGIDFVALVEPPLEGKVNRIRDAPLRVVGQAKLAWSSTIGPDPMAAFANRTRECREGVGVHSSLPEWFKDRTEPIVGLFVTAGRLGPDAKNFARRNIIFTLEGDQVAEDLTHSSNLHQWVGPGGSLDSARFANHFPRS